MSLGSLGVAAYALYDSWRARKKLQLFEEQKYFYQIGRDLDHDERRFLRQLHADELLKYRYVLYDHFCSKRGNVEALYNSDSEYSMAVSILQERYANIDFELKEHQNFEKLFDDGDWAAIIKCYNAFPESRKTGYFKELVKRAEERLRNVRINTDPCK